MSISPAPATIENDLRVSINALLTSSRFYRDEHDFEVRELLGRAQALKKVDPQAGFAAEARLHQLFGNADHALAKIKIAEQYGFSPDVLGDKCAILVNLGFFTRAQAVYKNCCDPRYGIFSSFGEAGVACGAIQQYAAFFQQAEKMGLAYDVDRAAWVFKAASVLGRCGISDGALGEALDAVGELMRASRMFFLGSGPDLFAWDTQEAESFIHLAYRFPLQAPEAERLDTLLVERLLDAERLLPDCVSITMKSGLPLHERVPSRVAAGSGEASSNRL